jgi:hypothetical protein
MTQYLSQVLYDVSNGNWILYSGCCAAMLTRPLCNSDFACHDSALASPSFAQR